MSDLVTEKFVISGVYNIVNSGQGKTVTIGVHGAERYLDSSSTNTHAWAIIMSAEKKWQIRSQTTGDSWGANLKSDTINLRPNRQKPHQWVIKRRSATSDSYILYSTSYPGRFLTLSDTREGAFLTLSRDANNPRTWWNFRNTDDQSMPNFGAMMNVDTELAKAKRPSQFNVSGNQIAVVVPAGWNTVLAAVPIGGMTSLIRVHHSAKGLLTTREFVSQGPGGLSAMIVHETGMDSHAILAEDSHAILTFEFFNSSDPLDPVHLPERGNQSSDLRVISAGRPDSAQHLRDYQMFEILDQSLVSGSTGSLRRGKINSILHVQLSNTADTIVDLDDPGAPEPATANPGFHDALDMPRPDTMEEYLTNYDIIFVVDDSISMQGSRWNEVRLALTELSKEAMQYDADGVEICFLNSQKQKQFIADPAEMLNIFDTVQPRGWTYTGKKLKTILDRVVKRLDDEVGKPGYADIKPVDIVVLTDGAPTDDPADAIEDAIKKLDKSRHHLNAVGIQFVQIGDEDGADAALQLLKDCPLRKMVDTVPYTKALTPQRLSEVLLGTLHPSIRSALAQKASTAVVECPICGSDDIPEYEYPRFPPTRRCQHLPLACRVCIARHVEVQIFDKAGSGVLTISCPSHPCPERLGYDEIRQWATPECFARYDSIALRQRISSDPNFRWCLNPKCTHGQLHQHGDASPLVQCTWCYKKSCFTHQLPWHDNLTCAEFDALDPGRLADDGAAKAIIENTTMQCTRCKNRIERSYGCDYMTCRCGHGFCWRCGASIGHHEVGGSHNHLPTCPLFRHGLF